MNDLQCKECGQKDGPMLVFVETLEQNGEIVQLEGGMRPYCEPCRRKLGISDKLNVGRGLCAEAKRVTLDAVDEARQVDQGANRRDKGISIIMNAVGNWVGGTDSIMALLGRRSPERPQEVFDGVSDAMAEIDPATMTTTQALGLITITNTTKQRIENWRSFVERTYEHLKQTVSERADDILKEFI